jgi:ribosome biogenesis GTPase / thiamine phosphate phosphatase
MLDQYGWDDRAERLYEPHREIGHPARVLVEHRGRYQVVTESGERGAVVSGQLRYSASADGDLPAVGDWVVVADADAETVVVRAILPRRSQFVRPAPDGGGSGQVVAANVDVVLLVSGLDHDFNPRRIERYVALTLSSGADPVIVLNKADVCDDLAGRIADANAVAPGVPVRVVAARDGTGLVSLTPLLEPGSTVALLGSSGVGKSTLINALLGWQRQQTGDVRSDDQRGRHTTTARALVRLESGALLIDSPGMRSVGMWDSEDGVAAAFADIDALAADCRFTDCSHDGEPGCAVHAAIGDGRLVAARLESQRKLAREAAAEARKHDAGMRASERRRWKIIQKSARNHARIKYGPEAG